MKKYFISRTTFWFTLLLFIGCNDFLDKAPDDRAEINSLNKVNQTLVGAYQNKRSFRFTFWSSDNATLTDGVANNESIVEDLYIWRRNIRNQQHQDSPTEYWKAAYNSIAHVNRILKELDNESVELDTPEDRDRANSYRGEALIIRAYNHFMLVNLFAKHFDIASADIDLGIPYTTIPENQLIVDYPRNTIKDVYNRIEKDLRSGITLIESSDIMKQNNKYRFTPATVYNFASRFYTFRNANEKDAKLAIQYAEKAIKSYGGLDKMRCWKDYYNDYKGFLDINRSDVGMIQASDSWVVFDWKYQMTYGIRAKLIEENKWINPAGLQGDFRVKINYNRDGDIWNPAFYFEFTGRRETSALDIFPLSEAILNAAEGYARSGKFNEYKIYMETIGKNVYQNYNSNAFILDNIKNAYRKQKGIYNDDEAINAMIAYCLFERRMMYLMKGLRWFDIKRYGLDVEHPLDDGTTIKLSEKAPNMDYQIPEYAINVGMQSNP